MTKPKKRKSRFKAFLAELTLPILGPIILIVALFKSFSLKNEDETFWERYKHEAGRVFYSFYRWAWEDID